MAEGWGGKRAGAGRPKGSPSAPQALLEERIRRRLARMKRTEDAKEFARAWLAANEPELLARVMEAGDLKVQVEAWKELRRYAYGAPPQAVNVRVSAGPTPEDILREIAEERRRAALISGSISTQAKALPAGSDDAQSTHKPS